MTCTARGGDVFGLHGRQRTDVLLGGASRGAINIFERWESQAARETFRSSGPDTEQRVAMLTVAV